MFYHVRQMAHPLTSLGRKWKLPVPSELLEPVRPRPVVKPDVQRQAEYLELVLTRGNTTARIKRTIVGPFITKYWIELKTKGGKQLAKPVEYFWKRRWESRSELVDETLQLHGGFRAVVSAVDQTELMLEFINNDEDRDVRIREVIESDVFRNSTYPLTVPLGLNTEGCPAVADLAAMPHLLITGMTGTGKSVFLKDMILGLIFKHTPEDLRFIIMAGMPELVYFKKLPHLIGPLHYFEEYGAEVLNILKWLEEERDKRLSLIESAGYTDLARYNRWSYVKNRSTLPHIVVILDHYFEFSGYRDWRTTVPTLEEVDPIFLHLVQTAHPAGIHLVITDQTPFHTNMSIALKESFQARIGFAQNRPAFSMMALGAKGAEHLAHGGDMLFRRNRTSVFERHQACNVDPDEAVRVVEFWREQM